MIHHRTQKNCYLHGYYSETIPIKISKGRVHIGQILGETRYELPVALSQQSYNREVFDYSINDV